VIGCFIVQVNAADQHIVDVGGQLPTGVVDDLRLDGRVVGV